MLRLTIISSLVMLISGCQTFQNLASKTGLSSEGDLKKPLKTAIATAQWQEQIGNVEGAKSWYAKALEQDPKSVEALIGLGRVEGRARNPAAAEKHFSAALKLAPKNPAVLAAIGEHHAGQRQFKQAAHYLRAASDADPKNTKLRYQLGVALAKSGNYGPAYPYFAQAVGPAAAHYNLGYILQQSGRAVEAEREYRLALAKDPSLLQAKRMLAGLEQTRGTADLKLAGFDNTPRTQPRHPKFKPATHRRAVATPTPRHEATPRPMPPAEVRPKPAVRERVFHNTGWARRRTPPATGPAEPIEQWPHAPQQ